MLDFEKVWFLTLVVIFLLDLYILNKILFQPMLKVFKEREEAIDGSLDEAKDMDTDRDNKLAMFKREMSEASTESRNKFDAIRQQGLDKQKEFMEAAAKEASGMIDKARAELAADSEKAKATLRSDVDKFSTEIVQKLLKV